MSVPPSAVLSLTPADAPGEGRQLLLDAVLAGVHDGVMVFSRSGEVICYNQRFLDLWKFPPALLAPRLDGTALRWAAEQTADPEGFLAEEGTDDRNTGAPVRDEFVMKDGRVFERCRILMPVGDIGEVRVWTLRDISERRHSAMALQRSEWRYRTLFNSLDEGFCVIRMIFDSGGRAVDYRFLEVNPAFASQTGILNPVGRRMREIAPDHEEYWFEQFGRVATGGEAIRFEREARQLQRWFDVYAFPLEEAGSDCIGILLTDVTARRLANESLRATEQFNRAVMESSPDCINVLDARGRIQFMNTGGLGLMEIDDITPLLNQPWDRLWPAEDRAAISAYLTGAMEGKPVRFQAMCPTAKGTRKWWDVMIAPIYKGESGSGPAGLISVSRDITESKQAELELRLAKEEAESASRAKDRLLATLSHELRTPLNPVLMTVSSLMEDPHLTPEMLEHLRMMERNIALEARLIDDLLDISRISCGKLRLRSEPCDIHTLIGLVVEMVRGDLRQKNLTLSLDLAARYHGMNGDPARLQQIFWNLLRNAVKFTPPGGKIQVRTRDAGHPPAFPRLHLEIQDSGVGISPEALKKIFEPFEQGQHSNHSASGGLGLGLAIARTVVDLHQGTLEAHSAGPGKGATLTLEAPSILPPSARMEELDPGPSREERRLRLLLVEDHPATLEALAVLLRKDGHEVTAVGTLAAARTAAAGNTFDGLVSDVGLPDGTGFELMEELSARCGLRGVVLSGYGMEDDVRRSREAGFVAHLVKPVRIGELRQSLRQLSVPEDGAGPGQ